MTFTFWLQFVLVCCIGAMSPGPSLALILRNSIRFSRTAGILSAIGHGFGIEHFYVTSNCMEVECDYSPIMYHSIKVFEGQIKNVTDKDVNMLVRIYGEDGFGGMTPKWIPRTCDIQCLEVDCGNSRMC